jgi:hypothetical protein
MQVQIVTDCNEMHDQQNIKFCNAKQAKQANQYKHIKQNCVRIMGLSGIIKLAEFRLHLHTTRSPTYSDIYQSSY